MKIPRYYRLPDGITLTYLGAFLYKIKLVDYFLCGNKLLEPPYFTFSIVEPALFRSPEPLSIQPTVNEPVLYISPLFLFTRPFDLPIPNPP